MVVIETSGNYFLNFAFTRVTFPRTNMNVEFTDLEITIRCKT
jgi:hypothetical protein